ncbi:DinB family protein [Alteribacillus bidgolensis]|uniref:Uncharacterized damage-inducible protein DinB (Forms a four-helix bundle) n=1 Tax=Alteribacillus bidgolensis TaxID=930129 RepID=A0A1G8HCE2_9BACI|nr:DinB family protein [Alteribacillus bidgolensis]SDI04215.1 Uncharacterized damage-inducible protein DinB (forms a four-helix bundle) [Alteribacillus bidgolensis]
MSKRIAVSDLLIKEFTDEVHATRQVLERIPEDKLSWSPHPKSMSLGQIALHTAVIPGELAEYFSESNREVPQVLLPEAATRKEILSAFDSSIETAEQKLAAWNEVDLMSEWQMKQGEETIMTAPRFFMLRSLMFNHWYHHRGQLTVYLRLLDVSVPAVYGSSADEN